MAGLWVWRDGAWREMQRPHPRQDSQWKTGKRAWAWSGSEWVEVWTDEARITVATSDNTGTLDLREVFDSSPHAGTEPGRIIATLPAGVSLGSGSVNSPALVIPDNWPWNPKIIFVAENAAVEGVAGEGGRGSGVQDSDINSKRPSSPGTDGGPALRVRYPIEMDSAGTFAGGGGGGGGGGGIGSSDAYEYGAGGGGGGAGLPPGDGGEGGTGRDIYEDAPDYYGEDGQAGSRTSGGEGGAGDDTLDQSSTGSGGRGGDRGQDGERGGEATLPSGSPYKTRSPSPGGKAGPAIDGASYITFTRRGTILGPEIN